MAKPVDAKGAREFAQLLWRERAWVLFVAIAGEQELEWHAALGQSREGIDQRQYALVGEHAPDIGRGDGRRRLRQGREQLGVHARSRNADHASGRNAELDDEGAGRRDSARWSCCATA